MIRRVLTAAVVVGLSSTACWDSTLAAARKHPISAAASPPPPLSITRNPLLHVSVDAVIDDPNATVVVVSVHNGNPHAAAVWVPIKVVLKDGSGKVVASNVAGGNDPTLTHFPSLPPNGTAYFVDDQFPAGINAASAAVSLGGNLRPHVVLPAISVSHVSSYASSGLTAFSGTVTNDSSVAQPVLIVQAVARKGRKIVAAGTAIVRDLSPHSSQPFSGFLLGNPKGATVSVFAPATAA